MEWVHHIVDAAISDPLLGMDLKSNALDGDETSNQSYNYSTISALDPFGSASFFDDAAWQDTAKTQQASLNELGDMFNRVGAQFPKLYHKVNVEHRSLLNRVKDDIKILKQARERERSWTTCWVILPHLHKSMGQLPMPSMMLLLGFIARVRTSPLPPQTASRYVVLWQSTSSG